MGESIICADVRFEDGTERHVDADGLLALADTERSRRRMAARPVLCDRDHHKGVECSTERCAWNI